MAKKIPIDKSEDYRRGYLSGYETGKRHGFSEAVESQHEIDSVQVPEETKRNETDYLICANCGDLYEARLGKCPRCNLDKNDIDSLYEKEIS